MHITMCAPLLQNNMNNINDDEMTLCMTRRSVLPETRTLIPLQNSHIFQMAISKCEVAKWRLRKTEPPFNIAQRLQNNTIISITRQGIEPLNAFFSTISMTMGPATAYHQGKPSDRGKRAHPSIQEGLQSSCTDRSKRTTNPSGATVAQRMICRTLSTCSPVPKHGRPKYQSRRTMGAPRGINHRSGSKMGTQPYAPEGTVLPTRKGTQSVQAMEHPSLPKGQTTTAPRISDDSRGLGCQPAQARPPTAVCRTPHSQYKVLKG